MTARCFELIDDLHDTCRVAIYAAFGSLRRVQARARCAEILNTRNGAK